MSDPIRPDFSHAAELTREQFKKKRSPVVSITILLFVVAGVSAGGYYLHKKFRAQTGAEAVASGMPVRASARAVSAPASSPSSRRSLAPTLDAPGEISPTFGSAESPKSPVITPAAAAVTPAAPVAQIPTAGVAASPVVPTHTVSGGAPVSGGSPVAADAGGVPAATDSRGAATLFAEADRLVAQRNYERAGQLLKSVPAGNALAHSAALYRLGVLGRHSKDEKLSQDSWAKAYINYPATIAGRMSALALADTWYYYYVESKQEFAQWEKIRDAYAVALGTDGARFMDEATNRRVGERLNKLTGKLIFDPEMRCRGAEFHTVRSGENPSSIAREYGIDFSSIVAVNGINPKALREGQVLKIVPGRMLAVVDKKRFNLDFFLDGRFIKRYRCATGAPQSETPPGRYTIARMDKEPLWTDPKTGQQYKYGDPGHLIGPRWLAMKGMGTSGLGIHGTVDPNSMGKKISNGCVRLLNNDVIELYGFASVLPGRETEVVIVE